MQTHGQLDKHGRPVGWKGCMKIRRYGRYLAYVPPCIHIKHRMGVNTKNSHLLINLDAIKRVMGGVLLHATLLLFIFYTHSVLTLIPRFQLRLILYRQAWDFIYMHTYHQSWQRTFGQLHRGLGDWMIGQGRSGSCDVTFCRVHHAQRQGAAEAFIYTLPIHIPILSTFRVSLPWKLRTDNYVCIPYQRMST